MKLKFWANTDVGKVRGHNEDNFLVDKKLNLFVVCDGMGGHAAGEVASAVCVRSVRESLGSQTAVFENLESDPGNSIFRMAVVSVVQHAIQEACSKIWKMAEADPSRKGMGTTCSLLLVIGSIGFVGHVGDSRIYLCRADAIQQITTDHSLINEMIRLGKIKPGEEDSVPHKNAVTRAVGVNEVVEVDAFEFEFAEGDSVLICSDGLSGYMEDPSLILDLMNHRDPKEVTEVAIERANAAGGKDNITAISIHFGENNASSQSEKNILKEMDLFEYLSAKELNLVFGICSFESVSSGKEVFAEGADPGKLNIIISGKIDIRSNNEGVKTLVRGDSFSEFSVLNSDPIRYSARACENTRLMSLERNIFMGLMKTEPVLAVKILWNFLQRYSHLSHALAPRQLFASASTSQGLQEVSASLEPLVLEHHSEPMPVFPTSIAADSQASIEAETSPMAGDSTAPISKKTPLSGVVSAAKKRTVPKKTSGISGKSVVKASTAPPAMIVDETIEIDIHDDSYEEIN